ncbi:ABC transporter substrate-binding protein [Pseudonocardia nematodicida]|uniref:ABC transporter substrate-binding protein n=1 Tax=Pseudonocardia nematodicida TaxID=1206997 RepID=A0ABV1KHY8_9PSEU
MTHAVRTRSRPRLLLTATLSVLAVLLAGCGGSPGPDTGNSPVSIGTLPFAGVAGWQVASDEGYFAEAGIEVEYVELRTPADVVPNLLNGTVNLGALNIGNLSQALAQGLDLSIIGVTYYADNDMSILTMKGSGISAPADLEGRTVGLFQLENANHAALLETLEGQGVDTAAIEFVLIPATEMPAALRSGQVDAGHVLYPLATTMADETDIVIENMMEPYGEQPVQAYNIVNTAWAEQNPDVVAGLQQALARGNERAGTDQDALIAAVAELTGAPTELLAASKLPAFGSDLKLDSSRRQLEIMTKYGFLDAPVDLAAHVYRNQETG